MFARKFCARPDNRGALWAYAARSLPYAAKSLPDAAKSLPDAARSLPDAARAEPLPYLFFLVGCVKIVAGQNGRCASEYRKET